VNLTSAIDWARNGRRPPPLSRALAILLLSLASTSQADAQAEAQAASRDVVAELFTGAAWSLALPLRVDEPEGRTQFRARYSTRPFADAPYYSYRVSRGTGDGRAIEAEMLHHKLYLENPRPPIEHLEVTHGYNLPTANVAATSGRWMLRLGMGLVVAHPEGRIAGRAVAGLPSFLGGGYHIAGITTQVAIGRRYDLGKGRVALIAAPEAKFTASWARMPIPLGSITVPNVAVHLLGGLGVRCRC
jgi:hypothetical protein